MSRWDDAGSAASARAEARAERFVAREPRASAYERPDREISVRERPERPDLLGIRLRDREPTLAERYGVSLIDREQAEHIERLKRDADAMIERWSSRDWQRERQDRPLAGSLPTAPSPYSFSIGPVLGLGPAVAPDGNSGSVPLIWSIPTIVPSPVPTVEIQIGVTKGLDGKLETIISGDIGYSGPMGIGRLSIGLSHNLDRPGDWRLYLQARVLGVTSQIDAERTIDAAQRKLDEAARSLAPDFEQMLRPLGLPQMP